MRKTLFATTMLVALGAGSAFAQGLNSDSDTIDVTFGLTRLTPIATQVVNNFQFGTVSILDAAFTGGVEIAVGYDAVTLAKAGPGTFTCTGTVAATADPEGTPTDVLNEVDIPGTPTPGLVVISAEPDTPLTVSITGAAGGAGNGTLALVGPGSETLDLDNFTMEVLDGDGLATIDGGGTGLLGSDSTVTADADGEVGLCFFGQLAIASGFAEVAYSGDVTIEIVY